VDGLFEEIDRRSGRIDILFNNAGECAFGHVDQLSEADWDTCLDSNLKGAFLMSRAAVPRMRQQGGGVIINNSSNAGLVARATAPSYCAAKAGLIMLTKSMAFGHAPDKIRVNAVAPGPVMTEKMERSLSREEDPEARIAELMSAAPLVAANGRMITPEEIASAVLFLSSDEASMITGTVLAIDGGKSAGIPR
jgi:NAD(P)-dependent dehydrogenase (short-subunit alcohol dehydrogenase family)